MTTMAAVAMRTLKNGLGSVPTTGSLVSRDSADLASDSSFVLPENARPLWRRPPQHVLAGKHSRLSGQSRRRISNHSPLAVITAVASVANFIQSRWGSAISERKYARTRLYHALGTK
jgi:hypothetical protein